LLAKKLSVNKEREKIFLYFCWFRKTKSYVHEAGSKSRSSG